MTWYSVLEDFDQANRQPGDRSAFGFLQMIASGQDFSCANSSFHLFTHNRTRIQWDFAKRLDSQAWIVPQILIQRFAEICLYGAVMLFTEIISDYSEAN